MRSLRIKTCLFITVLFVSCMVADNAYAAAPDDTEVFHDALRLGGDAFCTPLLHDAMTPDDVRESIRPSVVRISAGERRGSGLVLFIGEDDIVILTCRHVACGQKDDTEDPDEEIRVTFFTGREVQGSLLSADEEADLAAVSVDTDELTPQELLRIRRVRIPDGQHEIKTGDTVYLPASKDTPLYARWSLDSMMPDLSGQSIDVGNSLHTGKVISPSIPVRALGREMLYAELDASVGMSGGGMFSSDGELIGILVGGADDGGAVAEPVERVAGFAAGLVK